MSPWTIYLLASVSIAYPINYYFKTAYGEKNVKATMLLSLFWFTIPIISLLDLTKAVDYIQKKLQSRKEGA